MKKPDFLKKFTVIDYLIIIIVIAAIVFAFIHISSDNQDDTQSTSFDSSTLNKIVEKYLGYYREGKVVKTTVEGINATNGEKITVKGNIVWMDDNRGSNVKIVLESDGQRYLAGLYDDIPYADIYIDKISLETSDEKYNVTEITVNPMNVTKLSDLDSGMENGTNYEITTTVISNSKDSIIYQELINSLLNQTKVQSIRATNSGLQDQITLSRANSTQINIANNIVGETDGLTEQMKIMVYNCTNSQLNSIENNYDVINIRTA